MEPITPNLTHEVVTHRIRDIKGKGKARDINIDFEQVSHEESNENEFHEGSQVVEGGSLLSQRGAVRDQVWNQQIVGTDTSLPFIANLDSHVRSSSALDSHFQGLESRLGLTTPTSISTSTQLQLHTHHHHNFSDPLCTSCTTLHSHLHLPLTSPFTHLLSKTTRHIPRTPSEEDSIHTVISTGLSRITEIENAEIKLKALMDDLKREKRKVEAWVDDHRVMIAPVWNLPPEVLSEIFMRVVGFEDVTWDDVEYSTLSATETVPSSTSGTIPIPTDREREKRARGEITRSSVRSSVRLSWVCRQWRDVALHTPQLWTRICVVELPPPEDIGELRRQLGLGGDGVVHRRDENTVDDLESCTVSGTGHSLASLSSHPNFDSSPALFTFTTCLSSSSASSKLPMPLISLLRTGTSLPLDLHFKTSKARDIIDYFLPVRARWRRVVFDSCVGVQLMMRVLSGQVHVREVNGRSRARTSGINVGPSGSSIVDGDDVDRWRVMVDARGEVKRVAVGQVFAERDSDDEEGVVGASQTQTQHSQPSRNGAVEGSGDGGGGSRMVVGGEVQKERRFPMLQSLEFRGVPTPDLRETGWVVGEVWRPPLSVISGGALLSNVTTTTVNGNGNGNIGPVAVNAIVLATTTTNTAITVAPAVQIPAPLMAATNPPVPIPDNAAEDHTVAQNSEGPSDILNTTIMTGSSSAPAIAEEIEVIVEAPTTTSASGIENVPQVDDATVPVISDAAPARTSAGSTVIIDSPVDSTLTMIHSVDLSTSSTTTSTSDMVTSIQNVQGDEEAGVVLVNEDATDDAAAPVASGSGTLPSTSTSTLTTAPTPAPPASISSPANTSPAPPLTRTPPIPHPKLNPLTLFTPYHTPNLTSLCSVQMFGMAYTVLPLSQLRRYEGPVQVGDYVRLLGMMPFLEELFVQPLRSVGGGLGMGGGGGGGIVIAPPPLAAGGAPGPPLPAPGIMNGALASLLEPESSPNTPPHLHLRHLHISSSSIASTLSFSLMAGGGGPPWLLTQLQHLPPLPSLLKLFLYFDKRFVPPQPERTLYPFFEKNGASLREVVWGLSLGVDGVRRCLERCAGVEVLHVHRICGDGLLRTLVVDQERVGVGKSVKRVDGMVVPVVVNASETMVMTMTEVVTTAAGPSIDADIAENASSDAVIGLDSQPDNLPHHDGSVTVGELLSTLRHEMGPGGVFGMMNRSTPGASGSGSGGAISGETALDAGAFTSTGVGGSETGSAEDLTNAVTVDGEQLASDLVAVTVTPASSSGDGSTEDGNSTPSPATDSTPAITPASNEPSSTPPPPSPSPSTSPPGPSSPTTSPTEPVRPILLPNLRVLRISGKIVLRVEMLEKVIWSRCEGGKDGKMRNSEIELGAEDATAVEKVVGGAVMKDVKGKDKARAVEGDDDVGIKFGREDLLVADRSTDDLNVSVASASGSGHAENSGTDVGDSEEKHIRSRSSSDDAGSDEDRTSIGEGHCGEKQSVPWLLRETPGNCSRQKTATSLNTSDTSTPTQHAIQTQNQAGKPMHSQARALRELHFLPARLEKLDDKSKDRILKIAGEKTGMMVVVRQLDRAAFLSRRF